MIIEFEYNDKLRNVELSDEGKLLYDETMKYIQGLELDEKTQRRLFKKYIKKNMTNLKNISNTEKLNSSNESKEFNDNNDVSGTFSLEMIGKIIEFKYTRSNPDKIRKFEIQNQDQTNYYGYEIENGDKKYKVFNKNYINKIKVVGEKRKIEEIDDVVTSLKKMAVEPKIGNKISGGYINDSFTIENRSGSFVIQKILKGNKVYFLKINSNEIKEISNDEYTVLLG